jgi:AraC family transcriptional regulator
MSQAAKLEPTVMPRPAPRFEKAGPMTLAGLGKRFDSSNMDRIAELLERFGPHIGAIPGQIGRVAYGAWHNVQMTPFAMDGLAAVEISDLQNLPSDFNVLKIAAHRYAVFSHAGHVADIKQTVDAIFHSWLAASGFQHDSGSSDGLAFFERYGENFDSRSGGGDIEIWVPIKE